MTTSELALIHRLIVQVWLKKHKELPDLNQRGFGIKADAIREELQNTFNCFREDVDDGRGFRDNLKGILGTDITIKTPPSPITIEALCGYLYGEAPPRDERASWKNDNNHTKSRIWWERFKEDETRVDPIPSVQLLQKYKSAEEENRTLKAIREEEIEALKALVSSLEQEKKNLESQLEEFAPPPLTEEPVSLMFLGMDLCSIKTLRKIAIVLTVTMTLFALGIFLLPYLYGNVSVEKEQEMQELFIKDQKEAFYQAAILVSVTHLFIIAFFFLLHFHPKYGGRSTIAASKPPIINAVLSQFELGWTMIWLSFAFLYLWLTFKWGWESHLLENVENIRAYWYFKNYSWIVSDLFSIISTFLYFYIFFILDTYSLNTTNNERRNHVFIRLISNTSKLALVIFGASVLDRSFHLGIFEGIPVLLFSLFPAVGMAMFIERLNSHFFISDRLITPSLYSYAALQVTYPFLGSEKAITYFILLAVFILKIVLILVVNQKFKDGEFPIYISNMIKHLDKHKQAN